MNEKEKQPFTTNHTTSASGNSQLRRKKMKIFQKSAQALTMHTYKMANHVHVTLFNIHNLIADE